MTCRKPKQMTNHTWPLSPTSYSLSPPSGITTNPNADNIPKFADKMNSKTNYNRLKFNKATLPSFLQQSNSSSCQFHFNIHNNPRNVQTTKRKY